MGKITEWLGKGKTLLAFIGAVATFVLVVVNTLQDGFKFDDLQIIGGGLSVLLGFLGLGHKLEKLKKND